MKRYFKYSAIFLACVTSSAFSSQLVHLAKGDVIIPNSSIEQKSDIGVRAHTNYVIFKPSNAAQDATIKGETPASLACVYGLVSKTTPGCTIADSSALPTGGTGAIAIVDAFDDVNAEKELKVFSKQFNLPSCTTKNGCFQKVFATGTPKPDPDWAVEIALDIEWAHAMAPHAKIFLVEAKTNSYEDLLAAEDKAAQVVQQAGGGEVTNSWGGSEYAGEAKSDSHFVAKNVVFVASSGDSGAPATYPSSSPNVVSAGGTTVIRDKTGAFVKETAWSTTGGWFGGGAGGGPSQYEPRPAYQDVVSYVVNGHRGTPDISFDADPQSGVAVYSVSYNGWGVIGGTSVSSPALAGVLNAANTKSASSNDELSLIYSKSTYTPSSYWTDILAGNNGYTASLGYDFASGLGTPVGYNAK